MNYYINGDAAKAEQIKAAFEKLGYDINGWNFDDEQGIYYTSERKRIDLACGKFLINLIKTHPDYQELELPIEPKFKVGDWLYHNTYGARPILVKGYSKRKGYKVECIRTTYYLQKDVIENEYHFWSMADAKDGDMLVTTKIRNCPFIYRKTDYNNNLAYYYAGVDGIMKKYNQ